MKLKKIIHSPILIFCLLFSKELTAQKNNFKLTGTLNGFPNDTKVIFTYPNLDDFVLDTNVLNIHNNTFHFTGLIKTPQLFQLEFSNSEFDVITNYMFLDTGEQKISIDKKNLKFNSYFINGSAVNQHYLNDFLPLLKEYDSLHYNLEKQMQKLYDQNEGLTLEKKRGILRTEYINNIRPLKDSALLHFTLKETDPFISLWLLNEYIKANGYSEIYKTILNLIPDKYLQSNIGKLVKENCKDLSKTAIGETLPTLKLIDMNHQPLKISYTKNSSKYILIDFWFAHCGACIRQFPFLKDIYQQFSRKYFTIYSISIDNEKNIPLAKQIVSNQKIKWPIFFDVNGLNILKIIGNTFPSNVLINSSGKIIAKNIEPVMLLDFLKRKKTEDL